MIRVPLNGTPAERALRTLQIYDEVTDFEHRGLLLHAMTELGEHLGLECTGAVDGENADGTLFYSHDGDTCPIHEWLAPSDSPDWVYQPDNE